MSSHPAAPPKGKDKQSQFPTHFLALPLVTPASLPQLAQSVAAFQAATTQAPPLRPSEVRRREIAREAGGETGGGQDEEREANRPGDGEARLKILPQKAQRPPGTLHLTLGTMVLEDEEAAERALGVLRRLDYGEILRGVRAKLVAGEDGKASVGEVLRQEAVAESDGGVATGVVDAGEEVAASLKTLVRPVSPPLKAARAGVDAASRGIEVMLRCLGTFPSARKARVFYAVPHSRPGDEGTLQAFGEAVQRRFLEAGVLKDEGRPLTLHATVANLKYSKGVGGKGRGGKPVMQVDATEVLERFGGGDEEGDTGFVWADNIYVDRLRICKMGAVKSEDPEMGMEYPAIRVGEDGKMAEVVFA